MVEILVLQTSLGFIVVSQTINATYEFANETTKQPVTSGQNVYQQFNDYTRRRPTVYRIEGSITKLVEANPLKLGALRKPRDGFYILKQMLEDRRPIKIITPRTVLFRMMPVELRIDDGLTMKDSLQFSATFIEQIRLNNFDRLGILYGSLELYRAIIASPRSILPRELQDFKPPALYFDGFTTDV